MRRRTLRQESRRHQASRYFSNMARDWRRVWGVEADAFAASDGLDGDDVPDVFRDHVSDEEVDFFAGIDFAAGSGGFNAVAGFGVEGGGLDLDAEESVMEFDDGVVAVAVSPGYAD